MRIDYGGNGNRLPWRRCTAFEESGQEGLGEDVSRDRGWRVGRGGEGRADMVEQRFSRSISTVQYSTVQ
jgi:hypothetical protein